MRGFASVSALIAALCAAACSSKPPDTFPTDAAGLTCMHRPQGADTGWVATFPTFDATCATDADCDFAYYVSDCCGSYRAFGIRKELAANATALGTSCGYGDCGCYGRTFTDDGAVIGGRDVDAVAVACIAGQCTTSLMPSVTCGADTCIPGFQCITDCVTRGPRCVQAPRNCRGPGADCSCFGSPPCYPGGTCTGVGAGGVPICTCP